MTCDRVWRNCFFKHINLPFAWRSTDADLVKPAVQDIFWIECTAKEIREIMIPLIRDEVHLSRVMDAIRLNHLCNDVRGLNFLSTKWGTFVQYYPCMIFNVPGSAWESIKPVKFDSFVEFEKVYPKSQVLPNGVP